MIAAGGGAAQDAIVALREKLQRLREMSVRNARDRVVSAQVGCETDTVRADHPCALQHTKEGGKEDYICFSRLGLIRPPMRA